MAATSCSVYCSTSGLFRAAQSSLNATLLAGTSRKVHTALSASALEGRVLLSVLFATAGAGWSSQASTAELALLLCACTRLLIEDASKFCWLSAKLMSSSDTRLRVRFAWRCTSLRPSHSSGASSAGQKVEP
eukprot:Mycagemm_TRINITY_DN9388_c0_g1::TRINITY_DN9388_c0_g1_i1::g.3246::m.3246 type:complete len:132 gc:universal TRINITY_DN9388_c0_g1_i1:933-538(-)